MALQKNSFLLKGGLKITNAEPVDERILFPDGISDVTAITSAVTDTYYKGLVASTPEGKIYILTGDTPSSVDSWVDITGEGAAPIAKDILLGKDLVYSGETIAPTNSSITDAFDAVVEKMVENELTTAAALNDLNDDVSGLENSISGINGVLQNLIEEDNTIKTNVQNLSSSTIYIEENYAKKSDISKVYKIVSAKVVSIDDSGYTVSGSTTEKTADVGEVVNTVSSVTYGGKIYPVGTNFVCLESGTTVGKWDALAGVTEVEKVNSAVTAEVADTLKDFAISGSVSAFTITHEGNAWGINPSNKLVYGVAVTGTGVNVDANIESNKLELNVAVGIDEHITGLTKGSVLNGIHLTETPTAITASVTDYINSAATSYSAKTLDGFDLVETDTLTVTDAIVNVSGYTAILTMERNGNTVQYSRTNIIEKANSATNDAEGRNIADAFALLDQYPGTPTKPKANLTVSTTPALPKVVRVDSAIEVNSINFTATTVAGAFNEAAGVSPKTIPSYNAIELAVGVTGSSENSKTYTSSTITTGKTITDTFSGPECTISPASYGANVFKLSAEYSYGATNTQEGFKPKTLLGLETTKTGRTASDGTAVWTAGVATSGEKTITVYGGYPLKTNMANATTNVTGGALIGSGDTVTFASNTLETGVTNTEYVLYNPAKTFYFMFPPTTTSANKFYEIAFLSSLTISSIKKYNDLVHVYDGDVTYSETTESGMKVIKIQAPAESQAPQYRIIFS